MFITLSPRGVVVTFVAGFLCGAVVGAGLAHGAELPYCTAQNMAAGCWLNWDPKPIPRAGKCPSGWVLRAWKGDAKRRGYCEEIA